MIVKPETLIGWHRTGFRLWWRWKSRLGRPRIQADLRQLIVRMVRENPAWGEQRVAAELWSEKLLRALEKLRPESRQGHRGR